MNSNDNNPSGFDGDIAKEMEAAAPLHVETKFSNVCQHYVSQSGHTRLFTAMRYGKLYMLKGLKPDFEFVPIDRQALTKEFEIALQLDHPNICRTIGMEDVEGLGTMIVMEYVDGDTLSTLLEKNSVTPELALKIANQLADALDYIHNRQIIHRDLKPSNIMVTHNGRNVKLIDFSLSDSDSFGILKLPAGSLGYIAPEQHTPKARPDIKSDIYSLGMVLRNMAEATGNRQMLHISKACTRRNPNDRPATKQEIFSSATPAAGRRIAVALLLAAACTLALYIASTLHRRYTGSDTTTTDPAKAAPDNVKAIDYNLWDKP